MAALSDRRSGDSGSPRVPRALRVAGALVLTVGGLGYVGVVTWSAWSHYWTYDSLLEPALVLVVGLYRPLLNLGFLWCVYRGLRSRREAGSEGPARPAWWILVLAASFYAFYAAFYFRVIASLWLLALPIGVGVDLLTLVLLCVGLVETSDGRAGAKPRPAAVLIVAVVLVMTWNYRTIGVYSSFLVSLPRYERTLAVLLDADPPEEERWGTVEGTRYGLDRGPPLRVAFPWPGGLLDNWFGVVWDPTGLVLESNQFEADWSNWRDPELEPAKRLFGGDLTGAVHLLGSWYFCTFT